jgi:hypothetical protein
LSEIEPTYTQAGIYFAERDKEGTTIFVKVEFDVEIAAISYHRRLSQSQVPAPMDIQGFTGRVSFLKTV